MYVCLCNGYRDAEIRRVARTGVRCARRAYTVLGAEPRCGRCLDFAQNLIDRTLREGQATAPPMAYLEQGAD